MDTISRRPQFDQAAAEFRRHSPSGAPQGDHSGQSAHHHLIAEGQLRADPGRRDRGRVHLLEGRPGVSNHLWRSGLPPGPGDDGGPGAGDYFSGFVPPGQRPGVLYSEVARVGLLLAYGAGKRPPSPHPHLVYCLPADVAWSSRLVVDPVLFRKMTGNIIPSEERAFLRSAQLHIPAQGPYDGRV